MDNVIYLTTNQVIAINTVQIRLYSPKEPMGVKEPNLLESAINRPKQSVLMKMLILPFMKKQLHFLNQ